MKTAVKFFFLRKKTYANFSPSEASSRNCVIGRVSCYRCARSRSEESVSGGIAGASARENICEFSYRKPLFTFAYPDFSFVLQTIIYPSSFSFCPIPSRIIRLSKKIFTKKNTGKKGRVSVISPSFFVSTKNFDFNTTFFDSLRTKLCMV